MKSIYLIIPLLALAVVLSACSTKEVPSGKYDAFAKCLTEKNAVFYGTEWCPHCQNQKKAFGDSFKYVTFVDCDKSMDQCKAAGVEFYPTWNINGVNSVGEQNFYTLAKNAGCVDTLS